jgi:ADP-ribose pyrophosphatase YjhB (NUDIX family)
MVSKFERKPKIGVGVYILNSKWQLLLMKRAGKFAPGAWCPPGGKVEYGETFFATGIRETKEESDIDVKKLELASVTDDFYPDGEHYVTLDLKAVEYSGEPKIMEPKKFSEMKWFDLDKLPENLLLSTFNFFKSNPLCLCGSGKNYPECHGK